MKTRKRITIFLIILILLNINVSLGSTSIDFGTDTKSIKKEKPADSKLESVIIELNEEIPLDVFSADYKQDVFESIQGVYKINNETISFGFNNYDGLKMTEVMDKIKTRTKANVNYIMKTKSPIFSNYNKEEFKVDESKILKSIKVKKIKMKNEEFAKVKSKLMNENNLKIYKQYEKDYKKISNITFKSIENRIISFFSPITAYADEPIGGEPIGIEGSVLQIITGNPHMGDRQDRLGLEKRDTGLQYNWLPDNCVVDVFEINDTTNLRQVNLGFTYNSEERFNNLNIDVDEALEAEVIFYNYGQDENIPSTGRAYIYTQEYWNHNIPVEAYPYVDTRFSDEDKMTGIIKEVSYCIGIANTNVLEQGTKYWWLFQGEPERYAKYFDEEGRPYYIPVEVPDKGLAKVQFSRCYNFVNPLLQGIHPSNGHDEWSVFNEEYEKNITPIDFKSYNVPKRLEFEINDAELYIKRKTLIGAD